MRKTLCALLSGVLALSLCACGQPVEDARTDTQQIPNPAPVIRLT